MLSFLHGLHRFQVYTSFIERSEYCSCSGTCNQQLVSHIQFGSFYQELGNTDIRKVSDTLTYIYFPFRSGRSVVLRPLAEALSEIIPIPEATVEYSLQTFIPRGYFFIGKGAVRSYLDDTFTDEKIARWDERLKTVFNRGFWDGYYLGQRLGEWTKNYGSAATERKIYVGKGIRYFSNIGVAEFLVEAAEVSVGDKLLITGPTTGAEFVTLDEARVDLKPVQTVKKGQHFSMKSVKIRPSDKLYKLVSVEELKKFKGLDVEKQRG